MILNGLGLVGNAGTKKNASAKGAQATSLPTPPPKHASIHQPNSVARPAPATPAAQRMYTAESLATRQRALRELGFFIGDSVEKLRFSGQFLNGSATHPDLVERAKRFRQQVIDCYTDQAKVLTKHNGIDDVSNLADWNFLAQVMEPAVDEFISAIELLPPDDASKLAGHPSIHRFSMAVEKLTAWVDNAKTNIGNKRAEYDKASVHNQ